MLDSPFKKVAGEAPTQVFPCKICRSFEKTFFYRTPLVTTSETKHIHASAADLLHIRIGNLDWNEAHEGETKHIHASVANLLHIRIGYLDANVEIEKMNRKK